MTYEIPGLTGAEHAAFFGPDWYEEGENTEDAAPTPPKEAHPMHGKKPICNVCQHQIRPVDEPNNTGCRSDTAQLQSELCSDYKPVSHEHLADRVAVLGNMIEIVWDVVMTLLERAEKLPEAAP